MKIEKARFARVDGEILPFVRVGGVWYLVETKQTLIELGIATMIPVEDDLRTYASEPVEHFWATCPASEKHGISSESSIHDATNNLSVWKVARRFWEMSYLEGAESLSEMDIPVPDFTESEYRERAEKLGILI